MSFYRQKRPLRLMTALRSFRDLSKLSPAAVEGYLDSYVIYNLDWRDEKAMIAAFGEDYAHEVGLHLQSYYRVVNNLCAFGGLSKMYIPPVIDLSLGAVANQMLYEKSVAMELGLGKGQRVLDLGCGRGHVAYHMSQLTGVYVTGVNIDGDQIANARKLATEAGHEENVFVHADFNDLPLPFEDSTFDACYEIQALSLSKDLDALLKELHRVLKPAAKLSILDWAKLEAFNDEDPKHNELLKEVKPLLGAVGTPTPASLAKALENTGFAVLEHNNASIDGMQAPLIERVDRNFHALSMVVVGLTHAGILGKHFRTLFDRLHRGGEAFVKADRLGLVTTSHHILAQKSSRKAIIS